MAFKRPLTSKPRSKREKTTKEFSCEDFGCYWKKFRRLVKQNSLLIRTVAIINGKIRFELDDEKRLGLNFVPSTPYALWTLDNKEFERYGRDGLEQSRIYMTKLAELAHSNGINLTDVVYPWPDQILLVIVNLAKFPTGGLGRPSNRFLSSTFFRISLTIVIREM